MGSASPLAADLAMEKVKIDLLREKYQLGSEERSPTALFGRLMLVSVIVSATLATSLSYRVGSSSDAGGFPSLSLFSTIHHLVTSNDRLLSGEENNRVNFLLMGVGGAGHEGPQLADTILLASYQPSSGEVGMVSIPRDLAVPIPGYGWRKINAANAYGESDEPGSGPLLASQVVEDVFGQDINYYVRVDFNGFEELVDDVGGVDIYIDRSFTDPEYPILGKETADCGTTETILDDTGAEVDVPTYGCRYEYLTFQEGWAHMDGATALKYVRSRHGSNGEGSDFARSRRQQKILLAVKEKIFSAETALNPARITRIMDTLKDNLATNLSVWEIVRLADAFKNFHSDQLKSYVLDADEGSPLYATSLNGAYVLLPKNDDWNEVRRITQDIFLSEADAAIAHASEPKPTFVRVEIQNGTNVSGLAFRTSQLLDQQGYEVIKVGNAEERSYEHSVIYDLTNGKHPNELKALQAYLQADVTQSATGWLLDGDVIPRGITVEPDNTLATEDTVDFLVILGENSANLVLN